MHYLKEFTTLIESNYEKIPGFNISEFIKKLINNPQDNLDILNWIRFSLLPLSGVSLQNEWLSKLNDSLELKSFITGNEITIADLCLFVVLHSDAAWIKVPSHCNLIRFYNFFLKNPLMSDLVSKLKCKARNASAKKETNKTIPIEDKGSNFEDGGKFEDLPGAEMGKVVVRFPPEASGFIHIGHAKAALLNQYYRDKYQGKLILRFDDTNPEKENENYEKAILEDLPTIYFKHDSFSYTSDHFEIMLKYCEKLLKEGKAYADNTEPELMKEQREQRIDSKCRNNSVEENLRNWNEMVKGTSGNQKYCIRVKIDMKSDNGAMRDPTIYRCKNEPHVRTGTKYRVYPTYDFACPIVDSIEGVTHALRTSEYNDRNDQYYWMCDALGIRKPRVYDYSRLALQNTLLSKRKLTYLVEEDYVTGWDDPRMPTVRGILRHGMTPEGLRAFIIAQGSSRSVNYMEWDKLWAFNKKFLEIKSKRYTSLQLAESKPTKPSTTGIPNGFVPVKINGQKKVETKSIPNHPKDDSLGTREIWCGPQAFVEMADALAFVEGQNVTFINWGNMKVVKITREADQQIVGIEVALNLEDTDFKKTPKVNWLMDPKCDEKNASARLVPVNCIFYSHVLSKAIISKEDDFKNFISKDTRRDECHFGDPLLKTIKRGEIIQLMRKGFFICDEPYKPKSDFSDGEQPCVLIYIPDGTIKVKPQTGVKKKGDEKESVTEKKESNEKKKPIVNDKMTPEEIEKAEKKAREKEEKRLARKAGKEAAKTGNKPADVVKPIKVDEKKQEENKQTDGDSKAIKDKKENKAKEVNKKQAKPESAQEAGSKAKKQTKLGIAFTKAQNTPEWYTQVITKGEMLEYYDVSGCYILRPWSYYIWTCIQDYINRIIEDMNVDNVYFPMFVSKASLEKEKSHIADFSPEVAWVTRSGSGELAEPVAIRPTSETIMYPTFAKWVQSHRDLPIKINQWSNVVRWEFKQPSPFLRTREFLWQEGHTAYEKKADAEKEILEILQMYANVYEQLLAIPVVKGRKTEKEKFAGADYTTTVEAYVPSSGRGIQGATSHHLGQNFSKMFEVKYENPETKEHEFVYQNSWGMTTRTLGVMIMVHGDDQGLVLPPRIAKFQLVIVPCGITASTNAEDKAKLIAKCHEIHQQIRSLKCSPEAAKYSNKEKIRCHIDDADHVSPGWKFNHWELKGVPVRVEIGPKDLAQEQVTAVVRHNSQKMPIKFKDLDVEIPKLLDKIHNDMLAKALGELKTGIRQVDTLQDMKKALEDKALVIIPFCLKESCEESIKEKTVKKDAQEESKSLMGAKSLCIPFEHGNSISKQSFSLGDCPKDKKCLNCSLPAIKYTLFGRSY